MPTESPHPRVARPTEVDLQRNERMIDAVQGLSRQLAETERTLQAFISALSSAGEEPARPAPVPESAASAAPEAPRASTHGAPPAGLVGHVLPGAGRRSR